MLNIIQKCSSHFLEYFFDAWKPDLRRPTLALVPHEQIEEIKSYLDGIVVDGKRALVFEHHRLSLYPHSFWSLEVKHVLNELQTLTSSIIFRERNGSLTKKYVPPLKYKGKTPAKKI